MGRAEVVLKAADDEAEGRVLSFEFFEPLSEGGRAMIKVSGRNNVMGVETAGVEVILGDLDVLRLKLADDLADLE
jgi:hypothetical protein